eukprot:355907-Chlamydomonas_euryale.AAC.6
MLAWHHQACNVNAIWIRYPGYAARLPLRGHALRAHVHALGTVEAGVAAQASCDVTLHAGHADKLRDEVSGAGNVDGGGQDQAGADRLALRLEGLPFLVCTSGEQPRNHGGHLEQGWAWMGTAEGRLAACRGRCSAKGSKRRDASISNGGAHQNLCLCCFTTCLHPHVQWCCLSS